MEEFTVLKHCDLRSESKKDIIALKQEHWEYPYASQQEWLKNNLNKDDIHLLLYVDDQLSAYLNLVNVGLRIDNKIFSAIGIGNVCVAKCNLGKGYGRKIINQANSIIKKDNRIGVLLCKENLEGFYGIFGWQKVLCKDVSVAGKDYDKTVMLFNFFNTAIKKLTIDKNF